MQEATIPDKIGPYRIVRRLGEGGMGAVYEAVHDAIGRRVAIKVLLSAFAKDAQFTSRFFNEARAVNVVEHPGLVQISDFGRLFDGSAYLVMELLVGESLARRIASHAGPMPVGDALPLAWQLADSLSAAHAKGIVHRDLKPENVMLVRDPHMPGGERTKLLDFGIAKVNEQVGGAHVKTKTNALMGTPLYMSPEQCAGAGGVTDKSDVYSLGVMLFEMLAGQPPFSAEGAGQLLGMHMFTQPPRLTSISRSVPKDVSALVERLLGKSPDARPTMRQLAKELGALCDEYPQTLQSRATTLPADAVSPGGRTHASTLGQSAAQIKTTVPDRRRQGLLLSVALSCLGLLGAIGITRVSRTVEHSGSNERAGATHENGSVEISIATQPTGASIVRVADGVLLGRGPAQLKLPRAQQPVPLRITLPGHKDRELLVDALHGGSYQTVLDPLPAQLVDEQIPVDPVEKSKASILAKKNDRTQSAGALKKVGVPSADRNTPKLPKTSTGTTKIPNAILPLED